MKTGVFSLEGGISLWLKTIVSPQALKKEEEQRIYRVKSYIINHPHERILIKQLARRAALGEQKFEEGFWLLFGITVRRYIFETKMKTGNFLLRNTDKGVKEIASLCGYSRTRNFSSAYRKFFKKSPKEERL